MKKRKKSKTKQKRETYQTSSPIGSLGRYGKMPYRQLQKEAIIRGMAFPDVIESDLYRLIGFIENSVDAGVKPNKSLIEEYDNWMDNQLKVRGIERSPSLRLSYIDADQVAERKSKEKKDKPKREKKPPREKDTYGLIKGTKKSYTYELVAKGKTEERVIKRVKKKFPDANESSILIWIKKAQKQVREQKN